MIPGRPGSPASVAGGVTGANTLIAAARSGLVSPRIRSGSAGVNRVSDGGGLQHRPRGVLPVDLDPQREPGGRVDPDVDPVDRGAVVGRPQPEPGRVPA